MIWHLNLILNYNPLVSEIMQIKWYELENELFVNAIVEMFRWPIGSRKGASGLTYDLDDARDCIAINFADRLGYKWDGQKIKLYAKYCASEIAFVGPNYDESKMKIAEIEDKMTGIYIEWQKPYLEFLIAEGVKAVSFIQSKSVPAERIELPRNWAILLGCKILLGLSVEEGIRPYVFSSEQYGIYAKLTL